jgi:hypothetical protein
MMSSAAFARWLLRRLVPSPLRRLADWRQIRTDIDALPHLHRLWQDGGLTVSHAFVRNGGAPASLSLLIQPDGDVLLSVPSGFGASAEDIAAAESLIGSARAEFSRVAKTGLAAVERTILRSLDLMVVASGVPLVAKLLSTGPLALLRTDPSSWSWWLLPPVLVMLVRYSARDWINRNVGRALLRWARPPRAGAALPRASTR